MGAGQAGVSVGISITFLDSGHEQDDGRQRYGAACVKGVFIVFIALMLIDQNLTLYLSSVFLLLPYNLYLFGLSFCLLSG